MKPCVAPLHLYEPGEQSWALFIDPPTSYRFSVPTLATAVWISNLLSQITVKVQKKTKGRHGRHGRRGWHGKTQHAQHFRNRRFAWRDRVCARGAE